jgi:Cd(II)/Pb(II)-responsive transcriptional regulator
MKYPMLRIGELARLANCPTETIRYYERERLLPDATRTRGNYRLYGRAELERLSFIRNCRALDMTLDEVRELLRLRDLPPENCGAAHALLNAHVAHVGARIAELRELERKLKTLRRKCRAGVPQECAILHQLGRSAAPPRNRKPVLHVRGTQRG